MYSKTQTWTGPKWTLLCQIHISDSSQQNLCASEMMRMSVTSSARLRIHGCFVLNVPRAYWFGLYHKMYWVEYNVSSFSAVTEILFHNLKYIFLEPGYVARVLVGALGESRFWGRQAGLPGTTEGGVTAWAQLCHPSSPAISLTAALLGPASLSIPVTFTGEVPWHSRSVCTLGDRHLVCARLPKVPHDTQQAFLRMWCWPPSTYSPGMAPAGAPSLNHQTPWQGPLHPAPTSQVQGPKGAPCHAPGPGPHATQQAWGNKERSMLVPHQPAPGPPSYSLSRMPHPFPGPFLLGAQWPPTHI